MKERMGGIIFLVLLTAITILAFYALVSSVRSCVRENKKCSSCSKVEKFDIDFTAEE